MITAYFPTGSYRASVNCVSTGTLVGGPSAMGDGNDSTFARLTNIGERVVARFPTPDLSAIPDGWDLQKLSFAYRQLLVRSWTTPGNSFAYIKPRLGYYPTMADGTSLGDVESSYGMWVNNIHFGYSTVYWYYTPEAAAALETWAMDGDLGVGVELTSINHEYTDNVTITDIYFLTTTLTLTWTPVITPPDDDGGGTRPIVVGSGSFDRSDRRFER